MKTNCEKRGAGDNGDAEPERLIQAFRLIFGRRVSRLYLRTGTGAICTN